MAALDEARPVIGAGGARWGRRRGGLVTGTTVLALVAGLGLTILGLGASDHAVANYDASAWLWSSAKGEMARVNGATGRVDTRMQVPATAGHSIQASQTDRFLLLRDLQTGKVSTFDLATLQASATTPTTAGLGVTVAIQGDAAFIVDTVQGVVRQLDPRTLVPIGEAVRFPPGITGGTFDGAGRLWVAVPTEGTVSAVTAAPLTGTARGRAGGDDSVDGGAGPRRVTTVAVADPSNDLTVSALDDGVAVLNRTTGTLTTVRGEQRQRVTLRLAGLGVVPPRTSGSAVPVTVAADRRLYVVSDGAVRDFPIPGRGTRLRPAVAWAGRFYIPDDAAGTVYVVDTAGTLTATIGVKGASGPLELEVRENHLFINAPHSARARVVDDQHRVREVDKYTNEVPGGDPPPPPPPPPPPRERKPVVAPPGAPRGVIATAGNAQARVAWRAAPANGAAITRYVVTGAGRTMPVGAEQRSLVVTGLTNGEQYAFTVHAVNVKGPGPKRTSNKVVPTAEVPDPPASVAATAKPDGTVDVRWPAANGQGRKVTRYAVSAVVEGATTTIGESAGTALVIKAGSLEYGRQYGFTVVAINDRGANSKASPASATVVPFTTPGPVGGLGATTVADQKGAIRVQWEPAADNGRPIIRYVVSAKGTDRDVSETSAVLTGFGDGESITVTVKAVNEAGAGPTEQAVARTVGLPTPRITTKSATTTSITVRVSVPADAGSATCVLAAGGKQSASVACSQPLTIAGLTASSSYPFRVTARNVAGTGTADGTQPTAVLAGTAYCYTSSDSPEHRDWCKNNGLWLQTDPKKLKSGSVGKTTHGVKYQAVCRYDNGDEVYAYIYNHDRRSRVWIKVKAAGGQYYTPYAYFNLDGGVAPGVLRPC